MAITWTKDWAGSDDGTVLGGIDLKNIQDDLASVLQTASIGTSIQAWDTDLDTLSAPNLINGANLVKNGAFDTFTATPIPDNWAVETGGTDSQDTTNVRVGANSYGITSDADGSASRQTVYATINGVDNSYWRSKVVTLTAQVYATASSNARLQVDDGITTSESAYHTGTTGWEELSITHTISSTATKLDVVLLVDGNALLAKFDAVRLNHGAAIWQFVRHNDETVTETEEITAAGAVNISTDMTTLNSTAGAMAVTLAVPGTDMLGKVKTIEMTIDVGDVTLALTNITGGSAATTCTWANVDEALVLVGGTNKWHVIAESGVILS